MLVLFIADVCTCICFGEGERERERERRKGGELTHKHSQHLGLADRSVCYYI